VALFKKLYFQVLIGIAAGILLRAVYPRAGESMQPFGDLFVRMIRMTVAPIVFATVSVGIAKMGSVREVGRVGVRALVYFEIITTIALILGLIVANLVKPGAGMNVDPRALDTSVIANYVGSADKISSVGFLLNIIPTSIIESFARGDMLQILAFSIFLGLALARLGPKGAIVVNVLDAASHALFGIVEMVMRYAPIGVFGAMAFTVGRYGIGTLLSLAQLMLALCITCLLFVFVVLGTTMRICGLSLWKFLRYMKEEILVVFGTSTTEPVLPRMLAKLENLGCSQAVTGFVVPAGYSFNLDGVCIYLTLAIVFIAQATNTALDIWDQVLLLAILMLTSKGTAAVSGGAFVTLTATLASTHFLPVSGLVLLVGIDRLLSVPRALTSIIGIGVGTIAIAKWDGALDTERARRILDGEVTIDADAPEHSPVLEPSAAS
jgi:aerobic C4-dicarboxylate transport protein